MSPWTPTSNDPIAVTAFFGEFLVQTHSHALSGKTVTVIMVEDGATFGPNPPGAFTETLEPLAAGSYTIVVLIDDSSRQLRQTTSFPIVVSTAAALSLTPAVEYYNAAQDHYFLTTDTSEIRDLDRGLHPGWTRTGETIMTYSTYTSGAIPTCRFYIPPDSGDSHFFTSLPWECSDILLASYIRYPAYLADLQLETPNAFYMTAPANYQHLWDGSCDPGSVPVYRLWNKRVDSNHRYTTSPAIRDQMSAAGWISEGYGEGVTMCSPTRLPQ